MNPADEMVPKRAKRDLDDAAADPFDSLKEQLRAVFKEFESPSHQSKPVEDLHGADDRLDEPLPTTLKDFRRPSPQRKPEEEDEPVERDDLRLGITSYPHHEASERQANYDLSIENKMTRRSSRGFARSCGYFNWCCSHFGVAVFWQRSKADNRDQRPRTRLVAGGQANDREFDPAAWLVKATGRRKQSGTRCADCACHSLHRRGAGTSDGAGFSYVAANRGATRRRSRPCDQRNRQTGGRRRGNPCEDPPSTSSAATHRCPSTQAHANSAAVIANADNSAHVARTNTDA